LNLLLFNAEFGGNKGAEAMLVTVLQWLQERDFHGTVFLERSQNTSTELITKSMASLGSFPYSWDWFDFSPSRFLTYILSGYKDSLRKKVKMDMAIDLGGLAFQDASIKGCLRTLFRFLPLRLRRVPYHFFIQDFGPMKKYRTRLMASLTLKGAGKIFTRSDFSQQQVLGLGGLQEKVLGPYPDMTLRLKAKKYSAKTNLPRRYVVVSPSVILSLREGEIYLHFLETLSRKILKRFPIVILVHTFQVGATYSDSTVAQELARRLQGKEVLLLDENLDTRILKGVISSAELTISSRFHALVAALSSGVPALGLGWHPKYEELFSLYSIPEATLTTASSEFELDSKLSAFFQPHFRVKLREMNRKALNRLREAFYQLEQEIQKIQMES